MSDDRTFDPYRYSEATPRPEDADATPPQPSSTGVTLIAVFLMLMGLWGVLNGSAGIALIVFPEVYESLFDDEASGDPYLDDITARSEAQYEAADATLDPILFVVNAVNVALSVVFVVAAGGLLAKREWGRKLTLATVTTTAALTLVEIAIVGWSTYVYSAIGVNEMSEMSTLYASGDEAMYAVYFGIVLVAVIALLFYVVEYAFYWFAWRTLRKEDVRRLFR